MIIVIINRIFKNSKFLGITIFPFIILKSKIDKQNTTLINHEKIHLRQQLELLIIPFYVWYLIEYFIKLYQYKNKHLAYRAISFEREAYDNEHDMNYLKNRKAYSFLKYLK